MIYVALLRGINVGGNNMVDMKKLKATFEEAGMSNVSTYINSGNVVFEDKRRKPASIVKALEKAIAEDLGFEIKVLIRDLPSIKKVLKAIPDDWTNDSVMRCDVLFLWESFDRKDILTELTIKPVDEVSYVSGAIIWKVDRDDARKSGLIKIVGTPLYRAMTIRNLNTVRKLGAMMESSS